MTHDDQFSRDAQGRPTLPPSIPQRPDEPAEGPLSTSWGTVTAPWGTPGNHLTGPIPRIRKRDDGTLTHGSRRGEDSSA